jgi:hypothetical protein
MGDDIELMTIKVIQSGLLELSFINHTKQEHYLIFVEPGELFSKLGEAMQKNHEGWLKNYFENREIQERSKHAWVRDTVSGEGDSADG